MTAATHSSWGRASAYGMSKSFSRTAYMTRGHRHLLRLLGVAFVVGRLVLSLVGNVI
jgi:hypothetical protein